MNAHARTLTTAQLSAHATDPNPDRPLRLHLDPQRSVQRSVDGAWWPYGRDVVEEISRLITGAELLVGQIDRASLHAADWPDHPRRFRLGGRIIRLGFFSSGAGLVSLVGPGRSDIVLLVISPSANADEAESVIARAVDSSDRSRPLALLEGTGQGAPSQQPIGAP